MKMKTFPMSVILLLVTAVRHSIPVSASLRQAILSSHRSPPLTPDRIQAAVSSSSRLPSVRRTTGSSVCRCGQSSDSLPSNGPSFGQTHAAVIGGRESSPGSFPWIAGLLDSYGFNFCAGALIRRNFVLTAAHCVYNKKARDLSVVIGYTDLDMAYLFNRGHRVADVIVHPAFVHSNWSHDIALLRLSEPEERQEPICMPGLRDRSFEELVVAGWGRTTSSVNSIKPNRLHQVSLPQVNQLQCERTWAENHVGAEQMCAGSAGRDTCTYDSGSPLMSRSSDGGQRRTVLAGVTSFGSKRCGDPEKPGVYTRVASYLHWILFHTGDDAC